MTQLPIPVHVGSEPPEQWDDIEARQRKFGEDAAPWLRDKRRPAVASESLNWSGLGFEPRWIGFDAADCAAALAVAQPDPGRAPALVAVGAPAGKAPIVRSLLLGHDLLR